MLCEARRICLLSGDRSPNDGAGLLLWRRLWLLDEEVEQLGVRWLDELLVARTRHRLDRRQEIRLTPVVHTSANNLQMRTSARRGKLTIYLVHRYRCRL